MSDHPLTPPTGPDNYASEVSAARNNLLLVGVIGAIALIYLAMVAVHSSLLFGHGQAEAAVYEAHGAMGVHPPYWMVAPFVLLLGAIAVLPLTPHASHWWEHNRNKLAVALALGLATLAYYAAADGLGKAGHVFLHTLFQEYVPFIVLLFSLYTISGGIRITCDLPARPATNTAFLAAGGVLASFIGTTGAAMLLIRPLLATNSERKHVVHTVIFFIFVVCNCGGCLLPLGDPPLFMGYLRGVSFFWTLSLWKQWLFVNGLLFAVYFVWDRFFCYPRETREDVVQDETRIRPLTVHGWKLHVPLLLGVVAAVALLAYNIDDPKPVPGTSWVPWPFLREVVQLLLVATSLLLGSQVVRQDNKFSYGAIIEVAALFAGIFLCMVPAIEILRVKGPDLGLQTAAHFFWATGSLSSVLDNAPTYVVFFEAASTVAKGTAETAGVDAALLAAVSLGAVFLGSMTYIGNGPNFMVKTIAEGAGVRMPSFFGYVFRYSVPVLLPIFALTVWLFL
jgi:Na+/H+ antiporter NhaD/arsenite permease-like protein